MEIVKEFWSKAWNKNVLIIQIGRNKYRIWMNLLDEKTRVKLLEKDATKFRCNGLIFYKDGKADIKSIIIKEFTTTDAPVRLIEHKFEPIKYVTYEYDNKKLNVQKNGFMVYCAPSGSGKTYFAISQLMIMSKKFDTLLYINLELSVNDIYNRVNDYHGVIPKNLYVAPFDDINQIKEFAEGRGRLFIIVDNIDNLVGGGSDPFGEQLEFIKQLDRFLKDYEHHALVLTQLVKDTNISLFEKDGDINPALNTNILSGVKQLAYLSRTVMMTAYNAALISNNYKYKILKMGSAKLEI